MDDLTARKTAAIRARAEARRRIHEPVLRELHSQGLTDGEIAKRIGGLCKCSVRKARCLLNLPVNTEAVKRVWKESGRIGAARRNANLARTVAQLNLPVTSLPPLGIQIVKCLASGPKTISKMAALIGCGAGTHSHAAKLLRKLRQAGVVQSRSDYGGPRFRKESVHSLGPSLFSREKLTPLQQSLAASPAGFSTVKTVAFRYASNFPQYRDEIESAAFTGLTDAARLYDPSRYQFTTYLKHRVDGQVKDFLRTTKLRGYGRHYAGESNIPAVESFTDNVAIECDVGCTLEEKEQFEWSIRYLPDPHKEVLRLEFRDGLKVWEIAKHLGISESTIHARRRKAFALLRGEDGDEETTS